MIRVVGQPGPAPVLETVRLPGRLPLHPGGECEVSGLGRCRYHGKVNPDGSLDVFPRRGGCRSVMPDRVTAVGRVEKMR